MVSVDACRSKQLAKYVNDEHKKPNCYVKKIKLPEEKLCRLCIFAKKDVHIGQEIMYSYGPTTAAFWWRKVKYFVVFYILHTSMLIIFQHAFVNYCHQAIVCTLNMCRYSLKL